MDFELVKLGDVATFNYGRMPKKEKINPSGKYPIFSGYRIVGHYDEYNLDKEQLVVVARGVGGTGDVKLSPSRCFLTNLSIAVIPNQNIVRTKYLYYYFLLNNLRYLDSGSAQSQITINDLSKVIVPIPTLEYQDKAISLLQLLDEKIKGNTAINNNLEQQSFALFERILNDSTQGICTLSDIAELNPKRTISKSALARCIDMAQLSTTGCFPNGWETRNYSGGMRFSNGDTLLARITPCLENGKTAFINFLEPNEVAFGSTEYVVLSSKGIYPPEFFYCLARYPSFVDYAVKNMNGTSGRQRVSAETLAKYELPTVEANSLDIFGKFVKTAFEIIKNNSIENRHLIQIRDGLLPKLMAGALDVSKIDI